MHSALRFVCAVLTLLVLCISSVAEESDPLSNPSRVTIFSASSMVSYAKSDSTRVEKQVHSFRIPSLVNVNGVLVAIADARYDKPDDVSSIDIVATHSVDNGQTWKMEVIIKNSGAGSLSRVVEPTVVVKGTKIYVLVGSFNTSNNYWTRHNNTNDWDPLLVIGEVTVSASADSPKTASITWDKPVSLKDEFKKQKNVNWILFVGGTSTGLVMRDGTIVFPLQFTTNFGIVSSIMYSKDDGSKWTFAKEFPHDFGASEPSLVEWGDKLIMSCRMEDDTRRVYETSDMGKTWYESEYRLSRVWGNAPNRKGPGIQGSLIAVEIEGLRVMLFTLPLNTKTGTARDRLNLWMTDNNRIFNVGQVSHGEENTGYSSLLYHGDKLYCAHEVNNGNAFSIVLATLDEHLKRIKSTVKSWKENDKKLSDLCIPVDPAATDKGGKACGENITTSGLVGWLSGDLKDNIWKDKYSCVDAKVTNAIATPYGAKFYGSGSGALWPVSAQGQNRRYLFVNDAFTLTAIVSIHKVPEPGKLYPVMGGSWMGNSGRDYTALSYNSNRMWVPEYGEYKFHPTKSWKLNRKYHVAISLGHLDEEDRNKFSVYVDGECLDRGIYINHFIASADGIRNFYIGSPENSQSGMEGYITVSNVMLYNRKLSDDEIMTLSRGKYMIDERTMTISPSATLSLTPSLSLVPSPQVPKAKAPAASPVSGEQTDSAPTTHTASGSAPIQSKTVNGQKENDKSAHPNTEAALPLPDSTAVLPKEDNTVGAPSLPENPTSEGGAAADTTPKDSIASTTTTNKSGGNASRDPNDSGSAVTPIEQRTDSNTETSSSTSTSTSAPVAVRKNSGSGDASVSGLDPSHGTERERNSPQVESDKDKESSDKSASQDTHAALSQPKSPAAPPENNNTVSAPSLPENPTSEGGAVEAKPEGGSADSTQTNNSGGNPSRKPNDSGSAVTPTEQRTDSNTETSSGTSTSTSAPVEVPLNSNSGDASVSGLNPSHGAEGKSDPPQVESDKDNNKSSDSPYDDSDRAHVPLTSLLLFALLGFATFC